MNLSDTFVFVVERLLVVYSSEFVNAHVSSRKVNPFYKSCYPYMNLKNLIL